MTSSRQQLLDFVTPYLKTLFEHEHQAELKEFEELERLAEDKNSDIGVLLNKISQGLITPNDIEALQQLQKNNVSSANIININLTREKSSLAEFNDIFEKLRIYHGDVENKKEAEKRNELSARWITLRRATLNHAITSDDIKKIADLVNHKFTLDDLQKIALISFDSIYPNNIAKLQTLNLSEPAFKFINDCFQLCVTHEYPMYNPKRVSDAKTRVDSFCEKLSWEQHEEHVLFSKLRNLNPSMLNLIFKLHNKQISTVEMDMLIASDLNDLHKHVTEIADFLANKQKSDKGDEKSSVLETARSSSGSIAERLRSNSDPELTQVMALTTFNRKDILNPDRAPRVHRTTVIELGTARLHVIRGSVQDDRLRKSIGAKS